MKAKDFILIGVVILGFAFMYITTKKENGIATDHKIDSLYRVHGVLYNLDSIERRITKTIVDSLTQKIDSVKRDVKELRISNDKLHKSNEELYKKYESIPVSRPDF